jgi:outer membrane protein assembly factor BamB
MGTLNAHLLALNAQTGKLLWDVTVGDGKQQVSLVAGLTVLTFSLDAK